VDREEAMVGSPTVLVLSPSTQGYYFGEVLGGVDNVVARRGGRLIVVQTLELGARSDEIGEPCDFSLPVGWDLADAAISVTTAVQDSYLSALHEAGVPVVTVSARRGAAPVTRTLPDNAGGAAAAVEHLLRHGHRRIGFAGNLRQADIHARYRAVVDALAAHGISADPRDLYRLPENGEEGGDQAAAAFLASSQRPTAVILGTDRNAVGFLRTVREAGVETPAEVAVIGFDDIEAASFADPPLTTVRQSFHELGALAARLALSRADGHPVDTTDHLVRAQLVVRESCGCPPRTAGRPQGAVARAVDRASEQAVLIEDILAMSPRHSRAAVAGHASRLTELLAVAINGATPERATAIGEAVALLKGLHLPPGVLRSAGRLLEEQVVRDAPAEASAGMIRALARLESATFVADTAASERDFQEQFSVDTSMLGATAGDPRTLGWLAGTHIPAGVLATWENGVEGGRLEIVGVHDPSASLGGLERTLTMQQFPPRELIHLARATERQMCVIVPVRTPNRHWGFFALIAQIETVSARDAHHHWATLLGAALDQRDLQEGLHSSEQRYAAVVRATDDGMWEWHRVDRELYLSDRCRELLGLDHAATPASALAKVDPDDQERLRAALAEASSVRDRTVEVSFRIHRDGADRWLLLRGIGLAQGDGPVDRLVGSISDIDKAKRLEEQLREAALFDPTTGLPNRRLFLEQLDVAVRQHQRDPSDTFAVLFLDLDGFKLVNDSLGHFHGDEMLRVIGRRLRHELRGVDTAARFGGDEFAVLLHDSSTAALAGVADRLKQHIAATMDLGGEEVAVTASIGIATSDTPHTDAEDVLRQADIAMYHAKTTERGSTALFDETMNITVTDRLRLRGQLRTALAERQFQVHYQPIVALDGPPAHRFEALVRWLHPERGPLLPFAFLGALEDGPGIVELGAWILDTVCAQLAEWRSEHGRWASVAVNISHREFWSAGFAGTVEAALHRHGVPPECLALEITETIVMTEVDAAREIMDRLHAVGVRLHVDDFGTGQSSLHALRTFPVDALKIDGSFTSEIMDDPQTAQLVAVIVQMGRALRLEVIAECVETDAQAGMLRSMGCGLAQGWFYSKAVPAEQAWSALLATATPRIP
jgi:diguanylate cyclase (GGDEF)-like protein/PAS domain S-box-containing protein